MPILEDIKDGYDIARVMYCKPDNLRIIHGEDWYYIFDANEKYISVFDTARIKPRFNDEKSKALEEMWDGFYYILDESLNTDNKPKIISANFREDTSYLLYLYLLNQGVVEQVDEDYRYQIDSLDKERITKERQLEILKNISKIRKANIEATYIHEIYFKPSASYIMEKRKNDLTKLKAMI
jgi:hypothetical protein